MAQQELRHSQDQQGLSQDFFGRSRSYALPRTFLAQLRHSQDFFGAAGATPFPRAGALHSQDLSLEPLPSHFWTPTDYTLPRTLRTFGRSWKLADLQAIALVMWRGRQGRRPDEGGSDPPAGGEARNVTPSRCPPQGRPSRERPNTNPNKMSAKKELALEDPWGRNK